MSVRPHRVSLVTVAALTTALGLLTPSTTAAADLTTAPDPSSPAAEQALETVQELVDDAPGPSEPVDPTLALLDLAVLQDDLSPAQRELAAGYLARPTNDDAENDGYLEYTRSERTPVCSDVVCVHYVGGKRNDDRPDLTDSDGDGDPDYVEFVRDTVSDVHGRYVAAGYRAPLPDGLKGGDAKTDIYLGNIGDNGLYGYCTTDQDSVGRTVPAYCVLDNDYAPAEFPSNTPEENAQVTAAHEYYHAVQFGYDVREDGWFMEATATWAEDELYDAVDDNVFYLQSSPLTRPRKSMDQFGGLFPYGVWIFFRYLTERPFGAKAKSGMPTLVRDMWRRADAAPGAPDEYSLQAVETVLEKRRQTLTDAFARFSQANRMRYRNYEEGAENDYPKAPLVDKVTLTRQLPTAGPSELTLDHLTSGTVRYVPDAATVTGPSWQLQLDLDLMSQSKEPAALVTVMPKEGAPMVERVLLDSEGKAQQVVDFSASEVKFVELTVVNASDRFACESGREFSCQGRPLDDDRVQEFTATAVKAD